MVEKNVFVSYLETLKDDRGKLAALRRGLGLPPGTCADMYPVVAPRLPRNPPKRMEEIYYLMASLFGFHPLSTESGNMGDHMRRASGSDLSPAVERRFVRLLAAHWEDLPDELRQAVSFLKSKEIGVNWHQLINDLNYWTHPERLVQRRWANAFWGFEPKENEKDVNKNQ